MKIDNDLAVFLKHSEWYTYSVSAGYVPTNQAPDYAKKAMKAYNRKTMEYNQKYKDEN